MSIYRIRKHFKMFPSRFYKNIAVYHLLTPRLKKKCLYDVDGVEIPIIHVDTGNAQ